MTTAPITSNLPPQTFDIEEDALIEKFLACIPVVGIFVQLTNEVSLATQIERTLNPAHVIQLIDVKNDYKIAGIVQKVLTLAILTAAVFFNLFPIVGGLLTGVISETTALGCFTILGAFLIGSDLDKIKKNNEAIAHTRQFGLTPGTIVR